MLWVKDRPGLLSGSTLKWIAILTMLIDHVAYFWLLPVLEAGPEPIGRGWVLLYLWMRTIGRISLPLFCFLLAEGFCHTRDPKRYLARLCLFALLSEIPFDLANSGQPVDSAFQNIFFTLSIGLFLLMLLHHFAAHPLLQVVSLAGCCLLAELLRSDYGMMGVLLIALFWSLRERPVARALAAAPILVWLSYSLLCAALLALILIRLFNGQRGRIRHPALFYWFYPAHLLLLVLLRQAFLGN